MALSVHNIHAPRARISDSTAPSGAHGRLSSRCWSSRFRTGPRRWTPTALIAGLCVHLGCAAEEPPVEEVIRPVRYVEVLSTGGARVRTFSGTSQAGMSSALSFKVSGTIQALTVKVGDRVDKGQLIARIDPKDYELQLQEARAAFSQARAQERNAKANYDRMRQLYESQNVSKSDLDGARAGYESANALVRSASKRVELARRQLDYCELKSPSGGAISQVPVERNENVQPGQTIVQLSAGELPEVKVAVPEILISGIRKGSSARVTFDAMKGKEFEAVVFEVGVAPDQGATTYPVTVRMRQADPNIRPGLAAEVEFTFQATDTRERIIVPPVAVAADRNGRFVYVLKPTGDGFGTTHRRDVEVGELTTEGLEILRGIGDGELLVTAGVSRIEDNQRVRVPKAKKRE